MIAGLPAHEKQAFFGLLDEYFSSRPHRLPTTTAAGAAPQRAGLTDRATTAVGNAAGAAASTAVSNALRDQFARTGLGAKSTPPAAPTATKPPFPTRSSYGQAQAGRALPPPTRTGASIPSPAPAQAAQAAPAAPAPVQPSLPPGVIGSAQVLYDYGDGSDADDLQASEGEHIYLTEKISDDWWRATSQDQTRQGIIPTSYVRQL